MRQTLLGRFSWPLVALGCVIAVACLAGTAAINRLQAELVRAVRHEAAAMEAADELQIQLRHLRFHSLLLAAEHTDDRRRVVESDLRAIDDSLQQVRITADHSEDAELSARIAEDYHRYQDDLRLEQLPAEMLPELIRWSDSHHMASLIDLCRELSDRQRRRMNGSLERNERQSAWAGRMLLSLGVLGVVAGVVSGFVTARNLARRMAKLSARLLRAEQLAAVGQLAAGVAHEIRNPLTGVKLLLQAAEKQAVPLTDDRLTLLLHEVGRIERTVQGLVDVARLNRGERVAVDISETATMARDIAMPRAVAKGVEIDCVLNPTFVLGDRDQLLSVLVNLLYNAVDAAPDGSRVRLMVHSGDKIRVSVTDCGTGIDPAIAPRLFEPFATSKATGTGLGLAVSQRIAREHGGTLEAEDSPSGGACFTLTLLALETNDAEVTGGR